MKRFLSIVFALLMIASCVTVAAAAKTGFSDVEESRWSAASIRYAVGKGYMKGVGGDKFDPEGSLTRAMVATVLWRREGSPAPTAASGFSDVPAGEWYTDAVAWAKETGVVKGITDKTFEPDGKITREQLATMLFRFSSSAPVSVPERADLTPFSDDEKVSEWANEPLEWAVEAGLIKGTDGNRLAPDGDATREQFAAIIERYDGSFTLKYNTPVVRSHYTEPEYPLVGNADFYVSVNGDDSADGSFDHPFRTWERARDAVRALDKTGRDGVKVAFMAGVYRAPVNLTFTAEDSGTAECPVTYCKYGDGDVVFSAGVTLPLGGFTDIDAGEREMFPAKCVDRVKKINIEEYGADPSSLTADNALFAGRTRLDRARWPNKLPSGNDQFVDYWSEIIEEENSMILMPVLVKRLNKYHNIDDMYMLGYYRHDWSVSDGKIKFYDPETGYITPDVNHYGIHKQEDNTPPPYWYFYNIPDELDCDDEYYIDRNTGYLYVLDPSEDYTIAVTGQMITMNGADHITFAGLEFCFGTGRAVEANDCDYIEFNACKFHNIRGYGIYIYGDHLTVCGCEFYDIGARAIDLHSGDRETLTPGESVIENCLFDRFGTVDKTGMPAVYVWGCGIRVAHNEICNSSNIGIFYSEYIWASNDITIEYNYIHNVVKQSSDSGAIYGGRNMAGHGTVIRYNLICDVGTPEENHSSLGLYLDDCMSGQDVYGNIFYNTASHSVFMSCGRENRIHDNLMINPRTSKKCEILFGQNNYDWLKSETDDFTKPTGWNENIMILELVPFRSGIWAERFPLLSKLVYDINEPLPIDDPDCPFNPSYNELFGNAIITTPESLDGNDPVVLEEQPVRFATRIDETPIYTTNENPFFVNPTLGDYRLRADADFPGIPTEQIGRY
ncbi:MAG: S-layer homology domain-containing protein [Clostridia bacterium]|nr:S-layer homology domain-containing protein [Clostridia bacterium]